MAGMPFPRNGVLVVVGVQVWQGGLEQLCRVEWWKRVVVFYFVSNVVLYVAIVIVKFRKLSTLYIFSNKYNHTINI